MTRRFVTKASILTGVLLSALLLTIYRPSPRGVAQGAPVDRPAPGTPTSQLKSTYKLTDLKVFNLALVKIKESYVDPTRIDVKAMLLAALDSVQKNIPEVLVDPHPDKNEVLVQVNDQSQTFSIADVDSPWKLSAKLKEIFRFLQANMNPGADAAQVEYAAVNGILSTLDPHSMLMDPEQAKEMDVQTGGKFGGIGIVIGMKKGKLSVMSLIGKEVPAAKSGLKAGDHIVKINGQPTENLTTTEAMGRLRGDPQTKLVVTIERPGVSGQTDYTIIRDYIKKPDVTGHLLKGNVGYVKIDQFSGYVSGDLQNQMADLKQQGAKAWVLDLRGNPGGLLDQAIKVSDQFVSSGTVVTTVGYAGKQREEKRASSGQRAEDTTSPLVVLVNGGSASASEIVAGALKNLNRGVIIGRTSFGKGSVQVMTENDDGSKLKLTIAQYLTPGDVSIQNVGITPDVELVPVRVPDQMKTHCDNMLLLGKSHLLREADLESHIVSKYTRQGDKPSDSMKYLYVPPKATECKDIDDEDEDPQANTPDEENPAPDGDQFVEDYEIQFARDYVAQGSAAKRSDLIAQSKGYVAKKRAEEEAKVAASLGKLGIDWGTSGGKAGTPHLVASFTTDRPQNQVNAGDVVTITGVVKNDGDGAAYQVHAHAKTDDYAIDDTEFAFGRVDPGQTRTFAALVKISRDAASRVDNVSWEFTTAGAKQAKVDAPPVKVAVVGVAHPQFAYSYQVIDDGGNGDGALQVGESIRLHVTVKNTGPGQAFKTTAMVKNSPNDSIVVDKGRFELGKILPGETKTMDFTVEVKKDYSSADKELDLDLLVFDNVLRDGVNEKVKIPVRDAAAGPQPSSGEIKIAKAGAALREGADESATLVGNAKKGSVFRVTGKSGSWLRVELEPGRPAFVQASATSSAQGPVTANGYDNAWQVMPPTVAINTPSLETRGDHWKLVGTASDANHVEDVYVIVSNRDAKVEGRKVFYKSNRGSKTGTKLDFATAVPIWPGNNVITVVARENNEVRTMDTVVIYRTDGVALSDAGGTKTGGPNE